MGIHLVFYFFLKTKLFIQMIMNATFKMLAVVMVVALALPSCVSKKKFMELEAEKAALTSNLANANEKISSLEGNVSDLEANMASQKSKFESDIAGLRKDVDSAKSAADMAKKNLADRDAEIAKIKGEIKSALGMSSSLGVKERDGNMYVSMESPVNYRSGSARLNRDARKAIESLAESLKNNPSMHILIEGHTDSQQFAEGKGDNWDLSVRRAMTVVKRLIKKGVNPDQLTVAGRGEGAPKASNDTKEGRAENRRTEASVKPNAGKLYKIGN
jgi:chemotaxis protein MotB